MSDHLTRKSALINLLSLPLAATAAVTAASQASAADSKSPQNAVQYQNKPKGAAKCSGCKFFQPAKNPKSNGACKVVAGSISPNGWCVVYAAKS